MSRWADRYQEYWTDEDELAEREAQAGIGSVRNPRTGQEFRVGDSVWVDWHDVGYRHCVGWAVLLSIPEPGIALVRWCTPAADAEAILNEGCYATDEIDAEWLHGETQS